MAALGSWVASSAGVACLRPCSVARPFRHAMQRSRLQLVVPIRKDAVNSCPCQKLLTTIARAAPEGNNAFDFEEPETAKEAIDLGLVLCKQEKWDRALAVFEKGLSLPGTGVKRFRDKPRLISDGEKMALLYNIACCHSQQKDARSGLVALSGCLETGYTDFSQVRSDPDLEYLRTDPRFEGLLDRFQKKGSGFLGIDLSSMFGNK